MSLVSVIIPTYYRDRSLREAVESALAQTYDDIEVIVVDDSGEEYAKPIVAGYDVRYIPHSKNMGGNPARNTGYESAQGEYIQFLDDDDVILDRKIEQQVDLLERTKSVGVAYGGIIDRNGCQISPDEDERENSLELALQFFWPTTITSSLLISDEVLANITPLKNRPAADDIGMKIELAKETDFGFVDSILTRIGDSVDSRSSKIEFAYELEDIYNEYQGLYKKFPPRVERNALGGVYHSKAHFLIENRIWSPSAIYFYALAARYKGLHNPVLILSIFAALFGRPGVQLSRHIYERVKGNNRPES
ncbi:glycosyl transferase [Natrinema pellirubrum DSM 15624]|uniref:Glycosyl transferase n=1 Tax=Natrinema pellirubrum (strain DSM 15624 / CIP 106293 / JCM 10476 / NCIMB 786 / 157) TaxID=797303 RepID=L0JS71_NATP1|nr:glycosyltransferase family 2 protein [Natrinema pellirubrum]AGB33678.1 glycosyl transferase [Natrinema pellirubrum DSM 15624]ELY68297.1 glycosyl transferase [Natrinema pellirubrum DSM 15624]